MPSLLSLGAASPQMSMITGMVKSMLNDNISKIPEEKLRDLMVFCRGKIDEIIGEDVDIEEEGDATESDAISDSEHTDKENNTKEESDYGVKEAS